MRRVVASALRRLSPPQLPDHRHESCIEDRDEQDQDRDRENRQYSPRSSAGLTDEDRTREQKTDEHRSAVPHKDRRD